MPAPPPRYLSPAETAQALGVTRRALRIYERLGLVSPLRSNSGWRSYGPEALSRLHQVLVLKRLGLRLAEVATLISGRFSSLDAILELQESLLERRRLEAVGALVLIRDARRRLAGGDNLSLDDLTQLTKETTMSDKTPAWADKMKPSIARNFSDEERATMVRRAEAFDQSEVSAEWDRLIAMAKSLLGTDPGSPEAADLARRWRAQLALATGGDPAIAAKLGRVWKDSMADPALAPELPFGPEVMAFVGQAMARIGPESADKSA